MIVFRIVGQRDRSAARRASHVDLHSVRRARRVGDHLAVRRQRRLGEVAGLGGQPPPFDHGAGLRRCDAHGGQLGVVLGGVAPAPWRSHAAEKAIAGAPLTAESAARAGAAAAAPGRVDVTEAEVLDIDEAAFRDDRLEADLWPEYYDGRSAGLIGRRANFYQVWSATGLILAHEIMEHPERRALFDRFTFSERLEPAADT